MACAVGEDVPEEILIAEQGAPNEPLQPSPSPRAPVPSSVGTVEPSLATSEPAAAHARASGEKSTSSGKEPKRICKKSRNKAEKNHGFEGIPQLPLPVNLHDIVFFSRQ